MKAAHISFEIPLPWMLNPIDGERHRLFVANMLGALVETNLLCELRNVYWGTDEAPRDLYPGEVLFPFHSVGNVANILRLKEAPIPPLYAIDRGGHSGWSQIAKDPALQAEAKLFPVDFRREVALTHICCCCG